MNFFEFEDVWLETTGARPASGGAARRPASGGAARRPAVARPSPTAGPAGHTGRPASQGTRPQTTPAARSQGSAGTQPARTQPARTQPGGTPSTGARQAPARADAGRQGGGLNLGSFLASFQQGLSTVQTGFDFARQVPGFVQQFTGPGQQPAGAAPPPLPVPPGGDAPMPANSPVGGPVTAPAYPLAPAAVGPASPTVTMSPAADAGQVGQLLQALQQGQIPALPGPYATPAAPPAAAPPDAMAMLRLILSNPQFLSALQSTAAGTPRPVSLPVPVAPTAPQMRQVPVPLGAVLNAIVTLAGASMTNMSAATREDEPEVPAYLVDPGGGFIVDPASAQERAALVTHLFRLSAEAQGASEGWLPVEQFDAFDEAIDEGEATDAETWESGY